jgi:hypothetical protein
MSTTTEFEVIEFRPRRKGESLQGFLILRLPSGLTLHDCTLHQRAGGARWIGLPARSYTKQDGSTAWAHIVDFADKDAHAEFQRLAKAAVDCYFAGHARDGMSDKEAAASHERVDEATARVRWAARDHDAAVAGRK